MGEQAVAKLGVASAAPSTVSKAGPPKPVEPCRMCMQPSVKWCGGCRQHAYCSKECQRLHWRTHKHDCGRADPVVSTSQKGTPGDGEVKIADTAALGPQNSSRVQQRTEIPSSGTMENSAGEDAVESFKATLDVVTKHRETAVVKSVWAIRGGPAEMQRNLEEAKCLPAVKSRIEHLEKDGVSGGSQQSEVIATLLDAAEAVSAAKTFANCPEQCPVSPTAPTE
mmetsp:Transcript_17953/g.41894  ORF Transcript_17953/g.41894 Transcript_17953/m.41894 type:complete len:224 (-) Transcript_17953:31-702(-)